MREFQPPEKLAVLLTTLGSHVTQVALDSMGAQAEAVKESLAKFKETPPTSAEVEMVLNDFEMFFDQAIQEFESIEEESPVVEPVEEPVQKKEPVVEPEEVPFDTEEPFHVNLAPIKLFPKPNLTGNLRVDLNKMHPYQVATALANDSPQTIAIVLKSLAKEHAAKTLELFPEALRGETFLEMSRDTKFNSAIEYRVLEAALEGAKQVEKRAKPSETKNQMVALIRTIPKEMRRPMLGQLMAENEELGKIVKSEMYQFDDLLKLDGRSVQKLLGQCKTDDIVLALHGCSGELSEMLLGNMSKRARQTIEDEMQFLGNVRDNEVASAQQEIVNVFVQLEEAGEIVVD